MQENIKEIVYDKNKKYLFPTDLIAKNYGGYLLLISPSNGNWIVLENQIQIDIIKEMQMGLKLEDIFNKYSKNHSNDFNMVIKELEGKHFCETMNINENEFTLRIYLTNACNLRCKHCFMYASDCLENELTYEEILNVLEKSKKSGCKKVIFTGGEVTLKENFIEILKYAYNLGLYTQVLTNGTLWDDDMIKEASNYINEIQISIDGFDETSNSIIRGKHTYEKALNTVSKFINEKNVFVSIITTPLYEFLEKNKYEYIKFGKEMIKKFGTDNFLVIFGKELIDGRQVKSDIIKNKIMSKTIDEIYEELYPNSELTTFIVNHRYNKIFKNCGYGGLTINSNGDFYFCGRINEVKNYGNIRECTFDEILRLRKLARIKSSVNNIVPCNTCDIKYICGGGCRLSNVPEISEVNLEFDSILIHGQCTESYKENFYKLMIESNEHLYW